MKHLAIYVATWKRPDLLRATLRSILAQLDAEPGLYAGLNVVSNGSDDATRAVLSEHAGRLDSALVLSENAGLSQGYERLVPTPIPARFVMFSEDDMEYREPFGRYTAVLADHPGVGAASGYYPPEHPDAAGHVESGGAYWKLKPISTCAHLVMRAGDYQSFRPLRIAGPTDFDWHLFRDAPNALVKQGRPCAVLPGGALHKGWGRSTCNAEPYRPELVGPALDAMVAWSRAAAV